MSKNDKLKSIPGETSLHLPIAVQRAVILRERPVTRNRASMKLLPLPQQLERNVRPFVGRL
jgi:hypothetical protein